MTYSIEGGILFENAVEKLTHRKLDWVNDPIVVAPVYRANAVMSPKLVYISQIEEYVEFEAETSLDGRALILDHSYRAAPTMLPMTVGPATADYQGLVIYRKDGTLICAVNGYRGFPLNPRLGATIFWPRRIFEIRLEPGRIEQPIDVLGDLCRLEASLGDAADPLLFHLIHALRERDAFLRNLQAHLSARDGDDLVTTKDAMLKAVAALVREHFGHGTVPQDQKDRVQMIQRHEDAEQLLAKIRRVSD